MNSRLRKLFATQYNEYSLQTVLLALAFVALLVIAFFVDFDALLRYFKLLSGSSTSIMEVGAVISLTCAIPFLAMGMSISADAQRQTSRSSRFDG